MTQEELNQYIKYDEMFIDECYRVANILSKYQIEEFEHIHFADSFELRGDIVAWEGDEYWGYGGHEYWAGKFLISYLTMSEEELIRTAEDLQQQYLDKLCKKKLKIDAQKEKNEYEQYLKLKEKYDN